MHIFNLDLHPDGWLQFLEIDWLVKLNFESDDYDGFLQTCLMWLSSLVTRNDAMRESLEKLCSYEIWNYSFTVFGMWYEDWWFKVQISIPSCDIWLDFDTEEEVEVFASVIRKLHIWLLQAQTIKQAS